MLKEGPLPLLPQTIDTAVASPSALPTPKIIPEKMPCLALTKTTLKLVSIGDAPRAKEPRITSFFTALIEVTDTIVMVGMIIIASTKEEARVERPPALW